MLEQDPIPHEGRPPSLEELRSRSDLAHAKYNSGLITEARNQFEEFIGIVSKYHSSLSPALLQPYLKLVEIKFREGDFLDAGTFAKKAIAILTASNSESANALSDEVKINYSLMTQGSLITAYALQGDNEQVESQIVNLIKLISETIQSPNSAQPYSSTVAVAFEQCADSMLLINQHAKAESFYRNAIQTILNVEPSPTADNRNLNPIAHRLLRGLSNILRVQGREYDFEIHEKLVSHLNGLLQTDSASLSKVSGSPQINSAASLGRIDNFRFGLALSLAEAGLFNRAQQEFPFTVTHFLSSEDAPFAGPDKIALAAWLRAHNGDFTEAHSLLRLINEPATAGAEEDLRQYPANFRSKAMLGFVNLELAKIEPNQGRKEVLLYKAYEQLGGSLELMRIYFKQSMPAASVVIESICQGEPIEHRKADNAFRMMNRSAIRAYLFELHDVLSNLDELSQIPGVTFLRIDLKQARIFREHIGEVLGLLPTRFTSNN